MKGIADLIDSDMENSHDVLNSILSSASDRTTATKPAHAKKTRKRQRVTMPKHKTKIAKSSPPFTKAPTKSRTAARRKAIESGIPEAESDGEIQETQMQKPRELEANTRGPKKTMQVTDVEDEMEVDHTPAAARSHFAPGRSTKVAPKVIPAEPTVRPSKKPRMAGKVSGQETRQGSDREDSDADRMQILEPRRQRDIVRQNSGLRQESAVRRRAGSASDTERGDPNLRRKLGDVTRRFENVDFKYRNLKEVGISEANLNMEKLRKQCDAATQASTDLVSSLKKELATQAPLVQDARKLKKEMQSQEVEMLQLRSSVSELTASLTLAQNEIRALQARLAVARASSVAGEGRTPARDAKKDVRTAPASASETAQIAQMKEELYSDLTGLIVRSVKRAEDGDTYDCIQTGRNGTLHFKLFVDAEDTKNASFEETDFLYTPLLDANRDRHMIELMPTYLTEEITFARQNAAKFYSRVLDTLTKRQVDE